MSVSPRIDATHLLDFATAVYASAGMPEADARLVADTLVQADLWGHQSHGVLRLGWYLDTTWKVSCNLLNLRKQFAEGFFMAIFITH